MAIPLDSTLFGAPSRPLRSPWTHVVVLRADQLAAKVGRNTGYAELQEAEDEQHTGNSHAGALEPQGMGF